MIINPNKAGRFEGNFSAPTPLPPLHPLHISRHHMLTSSVTNYSYFHTDRETIHTF